MVSATEQVMAESEAKVRQVKGELEVGADGKFVFVLDSGEQVPAEMGDAWLGSHPILVSDGVQTKVIIPEEF